jgi:hypothetical protein
MRISLFVIFLVASVWVRSGVLAWSQEVPYTLEDRDRLIRIETSLQEFKASVDQRFAQVDQRFAEFQSSMDQRFAQLMTFMWILASVFGGLVAATIGFAVWDRRTALAPALRRSREVGRAGGAD